MELNNLQNESAKLRMTPAEKTAMKAFLREHYEAQARPISSTYFSYFSLSSFSGAGQFMQARVLAPLAVVLVVFAGAGTAAAAQGALPGDVLYPVKISVNETVEVALATTPVAKAEVSAKQAVRRVEEAEVLASRGELTPESGQALAANFEAHAKDATALTQKVEAEDPAAAESLRANLGSSLEAHGAILATLTEGGASANQEGAGVVAAKVLARSDSAPAAAASMRAAKAAVPSAQVMTMSLGAANDQAQSQSEATDTVSLEESTTGDAPAEQAQTAAQLQTSALEQIAATREKFDESKSALANSAITQVSGEFVAIDSLMQEGSSTQATADYGIAVTDYTEALKRATKLYVLLDAQANFKQNIISPILEKGPDDGQSYDVPVPQPHM